MDLFARVKEPLSVKQIVAQLGWPRSSVFNLVSTLVDLGYLYQPVPRGGYYPTTAWLDLAREVCESQPLPPSVHRLVQSLAEETGETVLLAAPEGTQVVFVDVVQSANVIRYSASAGDRVPLQATSAGRAILSLYSPAERSSTLKRVDFKPFADSEFDSAEKVELAVLAGQQKGWFTNNGSFVPGLAGVAVPFAFGARRNAIVLGAPLARVEPQLDDLGALLAARVQAFLQEHSE
ncbi:IclR family transcriptional regulator [Halioxenophilus aromaticivorans]|uniref:IclR family transcriptional regulator n=2 Tax=Halioxenophilus aromaticivorans TaxID=1306992 RepID=A0AAV3U9N0_9ALTE